MDSLSAPVMVVEAAEFDAAESVAGGVYRIIGYNGGETDWSILADRKCIIWPLSQPQAGQIAAVGASLRSLPADRRPSDFTEYEGKDGLLAWAKEVVQAYESASPAADSPATPPTDDAPPQEDAPQYDNTGVNEAFTADFSHFPPVPLSAYPDEPETRPSAHSSAFPQHWVSSRETNADGWAEPFDFWRGVSLPPVPLSAIPPAFQAFCQDQSAQTGVDIVQLAMNAQGIASAALPESIGLLVKPGTKWVERGRIWGCIVGPPSTGKGPGIDACVPPLFEIERANRQKNNELIEAYENDAKLHDGRVSDYNAARRKGTQAVAPIRPDRPPISRLWTGNATKEALALMLSNNPHGKISLIVPELASFLGNLSAYSAQRGNEKDRADFLRAYDGGEWPIDRVSEGKSILVPNWSVVILGGIQPSILDRFARGANGNVGLAEDGMLARFQVVISQPQRLVSDEARPDLAAEIRYASIIKNLVNMRSDNFLTLSGEAQEYRHDKAVWIHKMMNSGLPAALEFAIGKWRGTHARLALIYHCIDCASRGLTTPDPVVTLESCAAAWDWIERVIFPHAVYFYTVSLGESQERNVFRQLCEFILAKNLTVLTTTMLNDSSWFRPYKAGSHQRREFFAHMCEAGWLHRETDTKYAVNPAVHTIFEKEAQQAARNRRHLAENMPDSWKERTRNYKVTPKED